MRTITLHWSGFFWFALCTYAADLQVTLRIKDDLGKPVSGVNAGVFIFQRWKPGEGFGEDIHRQVNGITDAKGIVVLKGSTRAPNISYRLLPTKGYYGDHGGEY